MADSVTQTIINAMDTAITTALGAASSATHKFADANIVDAKLPYIHSDSQLPGVILTAVTELEKNATNASDDIGYGVQVTIAQASNRDLTSDRDRLYYWREQIEKLFRNRRLSTPSGNYNCTIEPKAVIDPAAFASLFDATAFVVRVWVRTQRPTS